MTRQLYSSLLFFSLIIFSCSNNTDKAKGEIPTVEDITAAVKKAYEYTTTAGDVFKVTINDIKIGNSQIANLKQELENIPKGALVTDVLLDYSLSGNINVRKVTKLWMYKSECGEWKFKNGSPD